ncbi:MAG: phosphatase PAP2 family protein [Anaerolineae bacterium]|nr:phosphatase PAP2 family protein [Anaerolineae bacterium]
MEPIWAWGIDFILMLQRAHPTLTPLFEVITFLGGTEFPLLIVPLIYWCVGIDIGVRFLIILLVNVLSNLAFKGLFNLPRPFQYDARVMALAEEQTSGFPSGHTQMATVMWLYLGGWVKRTWTWIVAAVLIALIALSRLYLGMHFPGDILGGFVFGLLTLWVFSVSERPIAVWITRQSIGFLIGAITVIAILLGVLFPTEYTITALAGLAGGVIGMLIEQRTWGFQVEGPWWQRALRCGVGLIGIAICRFGLKALFNILAPEITPLALVLRGVRYGLIGLWMTLGAPWVFLRLRLATAFHREQQ